MKVVRKMIQSNKTKDHFIRKYNIIERTHCLISHLK